MNYKLSDLKGIDQDHVERLRASRIETTSDLMEVWNDPSRMKAGRRSLSKHTPQTLLKRLGEVSAAIGLGGPVPTLVEVQAWFTELKPVAPAEDPTL